MVVVVVVLHEKRAAKGTLLRRGVGQRIPQQRFVQLEVVRVYGPVKHHRDDLKVYFGKFLQLISLNLLNLKRKLALKKYL